MYACMAIQIQYMLGMFFSPVLLVSSLLGLAGELPTKLFRGNLGLTFGGVRCEGEALGLL